MSHTIDLTFQAPPANPDRAPFAEDAEFVRRQVGDANLLAALGDTPSAKLALRVAARRLLAAAAALAVIGGTVLGVGSTPRAEAATYPLNQPVRVVLSGPYATLTARVAATAPTTAHGAGRLIAVSAPIGVNHTQVRVGVFAASGTIVPVRVTVPSIRLQAGAETWRVRDLGDGVLSPMLVDARSASRFASVYIGAGWPGTVVVNGRLVNYRPAVNGWAGSQYSPVMVQALTDQGWVTTATLTTDAFGIITGTVPAAGGYAFRLVRPDGATVWGATSGVVEPSPLDI